MTRPTQHWRRTLLAAMIAIGSPLADADFDSGNNAYRTQAWGEAFDEWQRCATQGVAACQYGLGILYDEGRSVEADLYTALNWYERAARQGHADAMMQLGFLYATGRGDIVQNAVLAWVWFARAASKGAEQGTEYRDRVGALLSIKELAEAQRKADSLSIEYRQQ
ncbi:MAG: TPR repeat protein [Gammaproteobacteria bacterium]|jgi:TPR repeat protein